MAGCAVQTFPDVSQAAWDCLKSKAAEQGIQIAANSGSYTQTGFTVVWEYKPAAKTLSMTCIKKPFWASCSLVNGKIHELIDSSGCLGK